MNFYYLSKEYGHTDACDAAFWSLDIAIESCVIPNGFDGAGVALAPTDRRLFGWLSPTDLPCPEFLEA